MKHNLKLLLILITIFLSISAFSETYEIYGGPNVEEPLNDSELEFKISGQYKNLFMFWKTDEYFGEKKSLQYLLLNPPQLKERRLVSDLKRIRFSPDVKYGDIFVFHVDVDNEIIMSSYNRSFEFDAYWRPADYNDLFDTNWEPVYNEDLYYRSKIHRAYAKISVSDFTLTLGRQQVRFGTGRLWNPLDILNPVSPTFIEGAEEQKATDAIRVDYYINETTEMSIVYDQKRYNDELDFKIKSSNSIGRLKTTIANTDYAVLGGYVARRTVCGFDISTILFDGTARGSLIYQNPEKGYGKHFIQGSGGYEYTFKNGIYFLVEYFYNGNNLNSNEGLKNFYGASFLTGINQTNYFQLSNQLITFNKHYGGLALGYDFMPLLHGEFFSIVDIESRGIFVSPSLKYNMMENLDISAGFMAGYVFNDKRESDFNTFENHYIYFASMVLYI